LQVYKIELEMQSVQLSEANFVASAALEKFTDLYDFAPVGYFSLDDEGVIMEVNLTGAAMLGVPRSRLLKRRFQFFVAAGSRAEFNEFFGQIFLSKKTHICEIPLQKVDHALFWANLQATPTKALHGPRKWCRVAIMDISGSKQAEEAQRHIRVLAETNKGLELEIVRRKVAESALLESERRASDLLGQSIQLQAELRNLSHNMLKTLEQDRKQISLDLHDQVTQILVAINFNLAVLAREANAHPGALGAKLLQTQDLVEQSVGAVDQFARDLRPPLLDDFGLIPALQSFIQRYSEQTGLRVHFSAFAELEDLDHERRLVFYRIVQESLLNVGKHANATEVRINLQKTAQVASLEIQDNGKSFATAEQLTDYQSSQPLGLICMRERVEMVHGKFLIKSTSGKGTMIRVEIPLEDAQA
jgi:PAS domain S-box-containing protein